MPDVRCELNDVVSREKSLAALQNVNWVKELLLRILYKHTSSREQERAFSCIGTGTPVGRLTSSTASTDWPSHRLLPFDVPSLPQVPSCLPRTWAQQQQRRRVNMHTATRDARSLHERPAGRYGRRSFTHFLRSALQGPLVARSYIQHPRTEYPVCGFVFSSITRRWVR